MAHQNKKALSTERISNLGADFRAAQAKNVKLEAENAELKKELVQAAGLLEKSEQRLHELLTAQPAPEEAATEAAA